ncbi:hypothetical protein V6N11_003900 [Hibiscus sabdariffa]|uniref:Uncharacterized protein n=1 Tax=Hibiscus sabdariffa TaxID=183260 RepID=A0ABR2SFD4_9ROSI
MDYFLSRLRLYMTMQALNSPSHLHLICRQLHEALEVTSVADPFYQLPQIYEEEFLEIDHLLNSDILTSNVEKPVDIGQHFKELNCLDEFDLYHDGAMFLQNIGPIEQGTVPFSYAEDMTS